MIKNLAWNTFKNTGDINTFLEFLEIENVEKKLSSISKIDSNTGKVSNNLFDIDGF